MKEGQETWSSSAIAQQHVERLWGERERLEQRIDEQEAKIKEQETKLRSRKRRLKRPERPGSPLSSLPT